MCVVHGKRGLVEAFYSFSCLDNAMECRDGLNKRGFARPYVLSEHTLVFAEFKLNVEKHT